MSDFEYYCPFCEYEFDPDWDCRGLPPICPKCGDKEVITTGEHEENARINAQEAENEGWQE